MISRLIWPAAAALALVSWQAPAQEGDYLLQPGDVVEIAVAGLPDLRERSPVQLDGRLSFPLVGEIDAADRTIVEVRERIRTALASRLVPHYTPDGRELMRSVDRSQVSAAVAEYRPVFVAGDVLRAGELAFRPGMTARQAVTAAGGRAPTLPVAVPDLVGLQADYVAAWHELATAEVRTWRHRNDLGSTVPLDTAALPLAPDPAAIDRIVGLENDLHEAEALDHARERAFLAETLRQLEAQAQVLRHQLEVERQTEATDAGALAAANALSEGAFTRSRQAEMDDLTRIANIRGAALVSATRRLQTEANLMQLERRRTEVGREVERLEDEQRVQHLADLQQAEKARAVGRAELDAVTERLRSAGMVVPGQTERGDPELVIVRRGHAMPVGYDAELEPGDVLEARWEAASPQDARAAPARPLQWPEVAVR